MKGEGTMTKTWKGALALALAARVFTTEKDSTRRGEAVFRACAA